MESIQNWAEKGETGYRIELKNGGAGYRKLMDLGGKRMGLNIGGAEDYM